VEIRLLVSDMDGTLLDKQGRISEENRDAIAWFCRQGGLFTLATGRMEASVAPYLEQVEVNAPLILYNGARLVDMRKRTVLWEAFLPPEAYELVEAVRAAFPDVNTVLYHGGVSYAYPYTERVAEHERKDGVACARLDRLADLPPGPLTKVLWIIEPERLEDLKGWVKEQRLDVQFVQSDVDYLECIPQGATKGDGLARLAELLGLPLSAVAAIGDNLNDYEMVRRAGFGVAVANAHPELKEVADWISPPHGEHAVAACIAKLRREGRVPVAAR